MEGWGSRLPWTRRNDVVVVRRDGLGWLAVVMLMVGRDVGCGMWWVYWAVLIFERGGCMYFDLGDMSSQCRGFRDRIMVWIGGQAVGCLVNIVMSLSQMSLSTIG